MILKGKTAIITGASDGLGKQVALKLAKEGVNLALIGRNEQRLQQTRQEAENLNQTQVRIYPCDIRKTAELKETILPKFSKRI